MCSESCTPKLKKNCIQPCLLQWKTFVGENFRKIRFSQRKLAWIAHWCHEKMSRPTHFVEKNFANSHKALKFVKISPPKVPCYTIYNVTMKVLLRTQDSKRAGPKQHKIKVVFRVFSELVRDRCVHRRPHFLTLKKCHCVVTAAHCLYNSKLGQGLHMAAQDNRRTNARTLI